MNTATEAARTRFETANEGSGRTAGRPSKDDKKARWRSHKPTTKRIEHGTASHRALNITEILKSILCCLPLQGLLSTESVSHKWRDLIDDSPCLQILTFKRPVERHTLWLLDLMGTFPLSVEAARRDGGSLTSEFHTGLDVFLVAVNSLFFELSDRSAREVTRHVQMGSRPKLTFNYDVERLAKSLGSRARDMFLTQPPTGAVHLIGEGRSVLTYRPRFFGGNSRHHKRVRSPATIASPGGVRVSKVLNAAMILPKFVETEGLSLDCMAIDLEREIDSEESSDRPETEKRTKARMEARAAVGDVES